MIDLTREGDVFVLWMTDGENRWNTAFVRAFDEALDEVEASEGPAALVTASNDPKFFSNGLDLDWVMSGDADHPGGEREVFGAEFMDLAGRLMRSDRGYLCANELAIGMTIPAAEIALFRHKIPAPAFHETVMLAKRWTGPAARAAGFVEETLELNDLLPRAIERAAELAPLATNRTNYGWQKQLVYGENAALSQPHGAGYMLLNSGDFPLRP